MIKPYSSYITEDCLDAIRTIDGKDYGLRARDFDNIRRLKAEHYLDIPSSITKGDLSQMTEENKRDAAGYLAVYNAFELDKQYGDDSDYFFRAMEKFDRSALLTMIHNTGTAKWAEQYNNPATKQHSLLQAAKSGIRENMVRSLISKPDGTLADWPAKEDEKQALYRSLVAIKLMYDTGNDSFANESAKEKTFKRWQDNEYLLEDINSCINGIAEGNEAMVEKYERDCDIDWEAGPVEPESEPAAEDITQTPKQDQNVLSKLTDKVKNLFISNEENDNVAQGNENINLQQGPSPIGGGANQQLG